MWELGQQEQSPSISSLAWWLPKFWGVLGAPQNELVTIPVSRLSCAEGSKPTNHGGFILGKV